MGSAITAHQLRQLLPEATADVDIAAAYAYPPALAAPFLRANMVASADGAAWGASGRSRGLSCPADRAIMAVLRGLSDVVLTGAGTARIEGYRPVRQREVWESLRAGRPATPHVAVVTRSLDLHPDLLSAAPPDARTLVFTTESAPADRRARTARSAEVVIAGETEVRPEAVVAELDRRGLFRVLCEGGPHLLSELTAAGLLDELCLTVSPRLMGPEAGRIVAGDHPSHPHDLGLAHVLESEGSLFLRYGRAEGR